MNASQVIISDAIAESYDVVAYVGCYPCFSSTTFVIGMICQLKSVSDACDPWTSTSAEVMKVRMRKHMRDLSLVHKRRNFRFAPDDVLFKLSGSRAKAAKRWSARWPNWISLLSECEGMLH